MFASIKDWYKKRSFKKALAQEIRNLRVLDCWGMIEEDYGGKHFEEVKKELVVSYLQKGLSQTDIDEINKMLKNEPIRLE